MCSSRNEISRRIGGILLSAVALLTSCSSKGHEHSSSNGGQANTAGFGGQSGGGGTSGGGAPGGGAAGAPTTTLSCDAECSNATSSGVTIDVPAGGDLQAAIDAADPGDTLRLAAGADYVGNFVLPVKSGTSCTTLRTATADSELPAGTRVTLGDAPKLARIISPGNGLPALRTDTGAHHYRLIGLELLPQAPNSDVQEVIAFGGGETALADVPHHLVVDRCYVHAWPGANFKRGIALNSANTCIVSSHVSDFHSDFQDSQAIGGFNGPGPFKIYNNRLEGGAENIMFGGATPSIQGVVPSDIEVRGNHLFKPLSWKAGDPSNTGYTPWVKNLFELKNAKNVTVDGNVMENNWAGADQQGAAIVLTPRSENGAAPWTTVENVTITNNVVMHAGGGVGILGVDTPPSQQSNHITVHNNLFLDIRADYAFDPAVVRVIQFTGVDTLAFDHNTFIYADPTYPMLRTYADATTGFAYTNNVVFYGEGIWSDCGTDQQAIDCKLPGAAVSANVIIGGPEAQFPATNFFPATATAAGLAVSTPSSTRPADYALSPTSPYANLGTDGKTPGIDATTIAP